MRPRVLVVDDDSGILFITTKLLGTHFDTIGAEDALVAIWKIDQEPFDVVVSDFEMPGLTGLDLLETLRETNPELAERFILHTGAEGLEDVGVPVLAKPCPTNVMVSAIQAMLSV